jgi:hypothetical protein
LIKIGKYCLLIKPEEITFRRKVNEDKKSKKTYLLKIGARIVFLWKKINYEAGAS